MELQVALSVEGGLTETTLVQELKNSLDALARKYRLSISATVKVVGAEVKWTIRI